MRRRPMLAFSGHKGVSWKSWDKAADCAIRSLNTSSHQALLNTGKLGIESQPHKARVSSSLLLESADDGVKLITP